MYNKVMIKFIKKNNNYKNKTKPYKLKTLN